MTVQIETTAPTPIVTLPTSIVCSTCKQETGITREQIMEMTIDDDICCPHCEAMIYSCLPTRPTATIGFYANGQAWTEYD